MLYHYDTVTIAIPSGEVHLVGGVTQYDGVVEIYWSGVWQKICYDDWDELDARVVCRQMGYLLTSGIDRHCDSPVC